MAEMIWQCPECGSDNLDVQISTWARLEQFDDNMETDHDAAQNRDHEWDEKSLMQCRDCGHCDASIAFQVEPEDDGPLYECQNCQKRWPEDYLKPIEDLTLRVAPGEPMPAGECPDCGALCHEITEPDDLAGPAIPNTWAEPPMGPG